MHARPALPDAATIEELDGRDPALVETAARLLRAAHPFDEIPDAVAREKLLGGNAGRAGAAWIARAGSARHVVGVAAAAGRWLKLLAVLPDARRRGLGTALLAEAESFARRTGATTLRALDHPGNYLSPGVDARAGEALAFLRARGFADAGAAENLDVPLADNPRVSDERADVLARRASEHGYVVRRAGAGDREALRTLALREFSNAWAFELDRALENDPPGVHLALDAAGAPVAFAAHDGNNRGLGWFGPAGTLPAHRGRGLGEALLLRCLCDIRRAGRASAVIAWIGPRAFYEKACGAQSGRAFLQLEKAL